MFFDYSTYLLEIDKLQNQVHQKMIDRDFGGAYRAATELLVMARHLQMYAKHMAEEVNSGEET